jgi:hypothetical protein
MKIIRSIGWAVRIFILLGVLAWVIVLYRWSKVEDPRFYEFVETKPGRIMTQVFNWDRTLPDVPDEEKSESQMTEEERSVKRLLEEELRREAPTHQLIFDDDRIMVGRLLNQTADAVEFSESYAANGSISLWINRRRIQSMEPLTNALPSISYRDVRFKMEHPEMSFYRRPPYTILTDESFFQVEKTVRTLQNLFRQFVVTFQPLIRWPEREDGIQVLFFSQEPEYAAYQRRYAPHMAGSSGFYSPQIDRLIVFNQKASDQIRKLQNQIEEEYNKHRPNALSPEGLAHLNEWRDQSNRKVTQYAEEQTMAAIRHEGSHQLFFTLGLHSKSRMENEWLIEGLATYCEPPEVGAFDSTRASVLKTALAEGTLIPLEELVNLRSPDGLMSLGSFERIALSYCESWALARFLMQDEYREAFFDYIRFIRETDNLAEIKKQTHYGVLCRSLGLKPEILWERWLVYVNQLAARL